PSASSPRPAISSRPGSQTTLSSSSSRAMRLPLSDGRFPSEPDALHPVVLGIDDVDPAAAVHSERPGVVKFAWGPPRAAPAAERAALRRKLLHAVVVVLDDVQVALRPEGQVVGVAHLPRLRARLAPGADPLAVAREDLDAVVAGVGDVEQAVRAEGHGPNVAE